MALCSPRVRPSRLMTAARLGAVLMLLGLFIATAYPAPAQAQTRRPTDRSRQALPVPPGGVAVTFDGSAAAVVTWQPVMGATGYLVNRTLDPAVAGVTVTPAPVAGSSFNDASVQPGVSYHYRVVAVFPAGHAASPWVTVAIPNAPAVAGVRPRQPGASLAPVSPAPPPPPAGIPPVNLRIYNSGPGVQNVTWEVHQPFFGFVLERLDPGTTSWKLITPQPVSIKGAQDVAFVPPGAVYRVTANYADGTVGVAQATHLNPTPPINPADFQATQVAEGTIELTWTAVPSATGYQLFGSGQPPSGTLVQAQRFTLTGVAPGTYYFRIATVYPAGIWTGPSPTAAVTVRRLTATYRISINGFTVVKETRDDPLDRDGKADEVFVAANTFLYDTPHADRPSGYRQAWTPVYGDVRGYPDRIQAGSGSPTGGLRTGDVVPAGNPAAPTTATPNPARLPLLVWEGSLTTKQQFLVVVPALWESDRNLTAYNTWNDSWRRVLHAGVGLASDARNAIGAQAITRVFPAVRDITGAPSSNEAKDGMDRPIGASDGAAGPVFYKTAFILTQDLIETALAAAGGTRVVIPAGYRDQPHHGDGEYRLYLQIERMP